MNRWKRYLDFRIRILAGFAVTCLFLSVLFSFLFFLKQHSWWLLPAVSLPVFIAFVSVWKRYVIETGSECEDIMKRFASNQTMQEIFEQEIYLSEGQEYMIARFREMIDINEMIRDSKKQAEYIALQNQINPHFLYNTLDGIRGETLHAGLYHVAEMTEALATFFRYTISNINHLVTVEDELENVQDYYLIQQYRFGDRLHLKIECEEEDMDRIMTCRLPKLTLQPIVENAVCHGIEDMEENGIVRITIRIVEERVIITVSDNGAGMSEEKRRELNQKLNQTQVEYIPEGHRTKGGIAVVNVNNRIRLLYGEEYGIYIYSVPECGTDVEITLPLIIDEADVRRIDRRWET